jgi:predicted Zn-dependent peptidase
VENLSRDFIVTYKNETYHSDDIIIAVAGNMEHDDLLRLLCGRFDRVNPRALDSMHAAPVQLSGCDLVEKDLEQVHLCLGVRGVSQTDERRYEAYLINAILGGSMSSRLFQEVRERKGLAYSIYSYMTSYADAGSLAVYAGTSPEHLDELLDITLGEMKKLKVDAVSPAELQSAKDQIKGNIMLSLESSDNRMSKLAKNEIYFGDYQSLDAIMSGFERVTPESLSRVCNELFSDESMTLVMLGRVGGRHVGGLSL